MTEHYLDNSATTVVSKKSAQKAYELMTEIYGNPSSYHTKGILAEREMDLSRKILADVLRVSENEVFFTSGGTEANNLALRGALSSRKRLGNKIVTTSVEHSSVLEVMKNFKKEGYEVVFLKPDITGVVSAEQIENAVDDKTILVSVMSVNNETGAVMPIENISTVIKQKKSPAIFHTDAVQAFGKCHLSPVKLNVDLLTVSAHKVHGPKGIGALYIKKGIKIIPYIFGGGQEKGLRPGTEAVPLIAAFGSAISEFDIDSCNVHAKLLNAYAKNKLTEIEGVCLNSSENSLPYIINISAMGIKSETMLHFLAAKGIYISSGSACSKGKKSYVLSEMGLPENKIHSALRISFSHLNTIEDIDALCEGIRSGLKILAR